MAASAAAMPSRIAWSSALRLAGLEIVRRRTPSAGRSVRTSPLMVRESSARPYSRTTSVSPSFTACPSSQRISLTAPASSASTGISIFIDSRTTTVSPSSICSPTWHSIFHTVPVMWATTSGTDVLLVGCARSVPGGVDGPAGRGAARGVRWRRERRAREAASRAGRPRRPDADPRAGLPRPAARRGLRPVSRARAHPQAGPRLRGRAPRDVALRLDAVPGARHRARPRPAERPGDPRAEPLVVHGPLLPRRVDPPEGVVHGEVAALHAAAAVHLLARRRVPGAARVPRRGGVRHRGGDPRARRLHRDVLRGRALAERAHRRPGAPGDRAAGARVGRDGGAGGNPRIRARAQLEAAEVPEGDGAVR